MVSLSFRKVLLLYLVLFLFNSLVLLASTDSISSKQLFGRRRLLEMGDEEGEVVQIKKKSSSSSTKNQSKLLKPNLSTKNQTKLEKSNLSSKNQTKIAKIKPTNSTKTSISSLSKSELKKLNSTSQIKKMSSSNSQLKKLNSTSKASNSTKSSSGLLKSNSPKNKTTKSTSNSKIQTGSLKQIDPESAKPKKEQQSQSTEKKAIQKQKQKQPSWIEQDEEDDLVSEFRDLPNKFQKTLIPDLERISTQSKAYITKYNKEITNQFKPIVGKKHAPTIATAISFAFIVIPLILVSLIVNRIKAYFSLQKVLIFIQVYLSIYFSILCLSSVVTGLEPLRFFYASSPATYICLQVFQTLGYVLYLLLLLMYLVLVFSTDCGLGSKFLGLGQTVVGFAVGLHYYVAVFHRVVLRQPPKTNWKIHGIYATCFLLICLASQAERRKKTYLEEGGEEGKKN